jgi:hypothetical protein
MTYEQPDLQQIVNMIVAKEITVDTTSMIYPAIYSKYGRTLHKVEDIMMREKWRTEMTTCDWIHGDTEVINSHIAFNDYPPHTHYKLNLQDKGWWEGYTQQETVIIEGFMGQIPYGELLELIDKWPHSVLRRRREPIPFMSKHIIITSSMLPEQVYHNLSEYDNIEALNRRINIIHV